MLIFHGVIDHGHFHSDEKIPEHIHAEAEIVILEKPLEKKHGWKRPVKKIKISEHDLASKYLKEEREN